MQLLVWRLILRYMRDIKYISCVLQVELAAAYTAFFEEVWHSPCVYSWSRYQVLLTTGLLAYQHLSPLQANTRKARCVAESVVDGSTTRKKVEDVLVLRKHMC